MRKVTLFLIISFFFSCKSSNGLKLIDAKELINNTKDYSISINKNWYSYSESHGLLWNSPKELKKEGVIYYANKFSVNSSKSKHDNIEDLVNSKVNNLKSIYKDFKGTKQFFEDDNYGKYAIIKYNHNWNLITYTVSEVLYMYKGKTYILNYSSWSRFYEKYLPQVLEMIGSFKIKE